MPARRDPLVAFFVLLTAAAALPGVAAADYEGPGQKGVVPIGEDGILVPHLAGVADDRIFVALQGIPSDACRLVLDTNGTYAQTGLTWTLGDEVAYVWGEAGAQDAPYRVHAVWTLDLNGNCTVERTEGKTYWHDPRGRPFVELRVLEERPFFQGPAGSTIQIRLTVANNGTVAANVTAQVAVIKDSFSVTSTGPVLGVEVAPLQEVPFLFDVDVPRDTKPRPYPIQVNFRSETGWSHGATAFLDVGRPVGPDPEATAEPDLAAKDALPPPSVVPEEAPFPAALSLLVLVGAAWLRRRS